MKKVAFILAAGLTTACLNLPAVAQEFVDCNTSGLDNMKSEEQRNHVFFSRLGNRGKGNGGEAVDATVDVTQPNPDGTPLLTKVTCVGTADEDTGGTVTVDPVGIVLPNDPNVPEVDPGKSNGKGKKG